MSIYDSANSGHYYNGYTDGYQEGIEDAWQTARKLFSDMTERDIRAIFPREWAAGGFHALIKLKSYEAIEKVKEFEVKQKTQRRQMQDGRKECSIIGTECPYPNDCGECNVFLEVKRARQKAVKRAAEE